MDTFPLLERVDTELLRTEYAGLISMRQHPTSDLRIACYTKSAAADRQWDRYTTACRGLIFGPAGNIVARPLPKFFNSFEVELPDFVESTDPTVYEKLDGSLGIGYPVDDRFAVSTKGSFDSDQAVFATNWLQATFPKWRPPVGVTPLFEIIHPQNRIVVDYGTAKELRLIAAVDTATGADVPLDLLEWPGTAVRRLEDTGSFDAITQRVRSDEFASEEGVIAAWPLPEGSSYRLKIKNPTYLELHRLRTNLTPKLVHIGWMNGSRISENPDVEEEDRAWAAEIEANNDSLYNTITAAVIDDMHRLKEFTGDPKLLASKVLETEYPHFLFRALKAPYPVGNIQDHVVAQARTADRGLAA